MDILLLLLLVGLFGGGAYLSVQRNRRRDAERREAELEPVRKLVFEDVTVLGEELQELDSDVTGKELDAGERADYQRALDAYEQAKYAADKLESPDQVKNITEILEDGRYAMACVRARVAGEPLPTRRPLCFFDPRHGLSVEDVPFAPPGGVQRDVPACALDAERVRAGAEPDSRMVNGQDGRRVPYYQGGPAYEPYAAGYFVAYAAMNWMFMGMLFSGMGAGAWDNAEAGAGEANDYGNGADGGDGGDAGGDAGGGDYGGGDYGGGGDGGGWFGGDGGGFDFGF